MNSDQFCEIAVFNSGLHICRCVISELGQGREKEWQACVGHNCICRTWSRRKEAGCKEVMHDLVEKSKEGR